MAENLEIEIVIDTKQALAALKKLETVGRKLTRNLSEGFEDVSKAVSKVNTSTNSLKRSTEGVSKSFKNLGKAGKRATSDLNKGVLKSRISVDKFRATTKKSTTEFSSGLSGLVTKAGALKIALVAAAGAAAGFASLRGVVRAASDIEDLGSVLTTLLGSSDKAKQSLDELTDFAATTPFRLEQIAQANKVLLAFGISAEEIPQRLRELGNAAAATGQPINELATIFGQVSAAGRLTGERLLQLSERAVLTDKDLSNALGKSGAELRKLKEAGLITSEVFKDMFTQFSAEGGKFAGATIRQSKTLTGVFSTLQDNVKLLAASIGQEFLPQIKDLALAFIRLISGNKELIKSLGVKALSAFVKAIEFIAESSGVAFKGMGALISILAGGIESFKILSRFILDGALAVLGFARAIKEGLEKAIRQGIIKTIGLASESIIDLIKLLDKIPGVDLGDSVKNIQALEDAFKKGLEPSLEVSFGLLETGLEELRSGVSDSTGDILDTVKSTASELDQLGSAIQTELDREIKPVITVDASDVKVIGAPAKIVIPATAGGKTDDEKDAEKDDKKLAKARKQGIKDSKELAKNIGNVISGLSQGAQGAKTLAKSLITTFATAALGPIGQVAGPIFDLLSQDSEALKENIKSFFAEIPKLFVQIVSNVPVLLTALINAIPDFVLAMVDAIPEVIVALVEGVPDIVAALVEKLPEIITRLAERLPELITELADKLPDIIPPLIEALVLGAPDITIALAKAMPGVALSLAKSMPGVAVALANAVAEPIKKAIRAATGGGGGPKIGGEVGKATEGIKSAVGLGLTSDRSITLPEVDRPLQVIDSSVLLDGEAFASIMLKLRQNNNRI